jgi:iron complex outermembrane recepter protein
MRLIWTIASLMAGTTAFGETGLPPAGPALSSESQLEEVVVTAQKRSENLQQVPIAITAVSAQQITQSALQTTADLQLVTPGLDISNSVGYPLLRIRGVGTSANAPGVENAVATYIDGVYIASQVGTQQNLADVADVEVLKGPQGTLFGRNATGGLLQVTTRDPTSTPTGEFRASYGNFETVSGTAYVSGGLTNTLSANAFVEYNHQGEGWGTNYYNGEDVYQFYHDYGGRVKLLFESGGTRALLTADYFNQRTSTYALGAVDPAFGVPTFGNSYVGPWNVDVNVQPLQTIKGGGVSLNIHQDLGAVELVSITAGRNSSFSADVDFDLGPQPIVEAAYVESDRQFTEELQLQSKAGGPFQYVGGFFYLYATSKYDPYEVDLGGPFVAPLSKIQTFSTQTTRSYSGFFQGSYEFAPGTTLTAGIRYTGENKALDGSTFGYLPGDVPVGELGPAVSKSQSYGAPTWRLALDKRFTPDVMGYVSYNRGFKSGGYNLSAPSADGYDAEKLDSFEAGVKTEYFERTLRVNAAAFYNKYTNIQVVRYVGGAILIYNGAEAEIYGLDGDITWVASRYLDLSGGLSLLNDRFTSFPDADLYTVNPGGGYDLTSGSAAGNRLPYAADVTAYITLSAHTDISSGRLSANFTTYYNSGFYTEPDNFLKQSQYELLNATVMWKSTNGLSVEAWGRNLANTAVVNVLATSPTGAAAGYQAPRTFGLTVGYMF